jgi:protein SCO1
MGDSKQHDRRRLLAAGAAAGAAVGADALPELALPELDAGPACVPEGAGPNAGSPRRGANATYLPNVVVVTHEGRRALFYNDLLLGKTVLVNFFSIAGEPATGVTANLARVQPHLGERLGRDVFFYSITTDPERDTPAALADFARRHGARPGWLFLTAEPEDLDALRGRFFVDAGMPAGHHGAAEDCSVGMVRYGNESIGLWGAVPHRAEPDWIARRIDWITPKSPAAGPPRRRGPVPGDPFPGAVAG